ncbi:MAG TPA: hypothetical protein VNT75_03585 [Symbiobacteriaceae bacterium]|nr:hypothetical protein [Symbiobacteriaceae bacterium]
MKQLALILMVLFVVGCASPAQRLAKETDQQLSDLQSENARLKEQVKRLENERDELKKHVGGSLGNVGEVKVGREQAVEIAKSNAPNMDVKSSKRVEFILRTPDRWVSVWVLDIGDDDRPYQGTIVVDAITGDVLNATNAPGGP